MNSNDQREHATTFEPDDAPVTHRSDGTATQQQHYSRMRRYNQPGQHGKWVDENRRNESDWDATIEAVASQLELTDYQEQRAKKLFEWLPENHQRGRPLRYLAFAVCTIAGREDGREYHPNKLLDHAEHSRYKHVARELDIEYEKFYSCFDAVSGDVP